MLQVSEGLTEAGLSSPKVTHSDGWQGGAGCWQEASVVLHMFLHSLFIGLHIMVAGFLQSE